MGNSRGNYRTTAERTFKAYDKLPPAARKALQEAIFDYATQPIYTAWKKWRKGFRSGPEIAQRIAEWDQKIIKGKKKK